MGYTEGFKKSVIRKLLMPNNLGITVLSKELKIPRRTIFDWREKYRKDIINEKQDNQLVPEDWPLEIKYEAVIESKELSDNELGKWLREKGIKADHLEKWNRELKNMAKQKDNNDELRNAKKRIKELEKDLRIKEKALAEASALLVLKKKASIIWGEEEEDL